MCNEQVTTAINIDEFASRKLWVSYLLHTIPCPPARPLASRCSNETVAIENTIPFLLHYALRIMHHTWHASLLLTIIL